MAARRQSSWKVCPHFDSEHQSLSLLSAVEQRQMQQVAAIASCQFRQMWLQVQWQWRCCSIRVAVQAVPFKLRD